MERTGYDNARRLLNLLAYLKGNARSRDELASHIYGANLSKADDSERARVEKALQRDRESLSGLGYETVDNGDVLSLKEHVVDVELEPVDMTLLSVAMSSFVGSTSDHKTVESTVRKLLAGNPIRDSEVHLRVNLSHLPTILEFARAMSESRPATVTYQRTLDTTRVYLVHVMSLFYRSGHYYAACQILESDGLAQEPDSDVNLKICRVTKITLGEPTTYERTENSTESFTPFEPMALVLESDGDLHHLRERGKVSDGVITLPPMDFVEALSLLSDVGVRAKVNEAEYLERLNHIARLS